MGRKKVGRKKKVDPAFSRSGVEVLRQRYRSDRIAKGKGNFLDFFKSDTEDEANSTEMTIDKGDKPVEIETSKFKHGRPTRVKQDPESENLERTSEIENPENKVTKHITAEGPKEAGMKMKRGRSNAKVDKVLKAEDGGRASDEEDQAEHQMKKMKSITVEGLEVVILSDSDSEEVENKTSSQKMAIDKRNKSEEIETPKGDNQKEKTFDGGNGVEHNRRLSKENITEENNQVENATEREVIFEKEKLENGSCSKVVNIVLKKRERPKEGKQDPESECMERTSEIENPENKVTEHITGEGAKEAGMKRKCRSSNAEDIGRASVEELPKENNMSSENEDMVVDGKDKSDEAATDNVDKHKEDAPNKGASNQEQNEATKNTEVQLKLPPDQSGVQMNLTFIIKMP